MIIRAVDLFCGAGGTSTGLEQACRAAGIPLDLTAINHWTAAINTHSKNHPKARHLCEPIELLKPREVVQDRLHILVASPECFPAGTLILTDRGLADYEFLGNKEEQVRQIGNAVPVGVAQALLGSILATYSEDNVIHLKEVA